MGSVRYVRMWAEENYNNYDLLPIVRNYGPLMIFGICANEVIAYAKDFHAELYLREDELEELGKKGYDFYIRNDGLNQLLNRANADIPRVNAAIKRLISLDLKSLSNSELFQEYLNYVKPYGDVFGPYIATQPHYISKIEEQLKSKLSKFPDGDELFSTLTGPTVEFVFLEKGSFFKKSFAELLGSEESQIDTAILDESLYTEKPIDGKKKVAVIRDRSLSSEIVKLSEVLSAIGEIRLKMRFVWMPAIYLLELFLVELKRRHGIPKSVIRKYDADEFDNLILEGRVVDEKLLAERSKGFAKVLKNGNVETLVGENANSFISEIIKLDSTIKEFKGSVASKGFAKGKVVILSYTKSFDHAEKIANMSEGDILVSEMTRPNIIIACKKAGAIVTDEGGITSHAAIVSRELNKPCVIGTKIATKILKDGDLVEVDANKGIIKILS